MSEQDGTQVTTPQCPTTDNPKAWKAYWRAQGQSWRTEPEIDAERQKYLAERRSITPDIEQGIYPFKDIKLCRADAEWLLAAHENGRGQVDWNDPSQRSRSGLDLRGADLSCEDLRYLPLARLQGGLTGENWRGATLEQCYMAAIHLEKALLTYAHLEGSVLSHAHLQGAALNETHLESADAYKAHFEAPVQASWHGAYFDASTKLNNASIANSEHIGPRLFDVHWDGINLTGIDWTSMYMVLDEYKARKRKTDDGRLKSEEQIITEYEEAVRTYRQLYALLQTQGLNEDAARFSYRAQKLQRIVMRRQKKFGQYLFSLFLDLLAGYGYRPGRSVIWYLVTIFVFALTYYAIGHLPFFPDAFVFSLTSFHGRGFFPGLGSASTLHNPLVVIAAFEAVIGLVIEISFIATFTQRFFGK